MSLLNLKQVRLIFLCTFDAALGPMPNKILTSDTPIACISAHLINLLCCDAHTKRTHFYEVETHLLRAHAVATAATNSLALIAVPIANTQTLNG